MKKQAYNILAALGLLLVLAVMPAYAQSDKGEGHATIPFDFVINNQTFPAGTYTIARTFQGTADGLTLSSADGSASAMFNTWPGKQSADLKGPTLVFNR